MKNILKPEEVMKKGQALCEKYFNHDADSEDDPCKKCPLNGGYCITSGGEFISQDSESEITFATFMERLQKMVKTIIREAADD